MCNIARKQEWLLWRNTKWGLLNSIDGELDLWFCTKDILFFKEVYADQEVIVSLEISGSSEDASIYQFTHKFYLPDGTHCATAEATGVWIDMMLRKTTTPPDDILVVMNQFKTENTKLLSREDIKALPFRPENIDASLMDLNR